jgi:hypothetical protein
MSRWPLAAAVAALLAVMALVLGIALHPLAVDDAFITYRYAHNLATGQGFTYNAGRPVLSTTAPLWALLLAAGALVWPDIPALANTLSAIALGSGAVLVFLMGRREGIPWTGTLAALFFVTYPLLWLSLGLETVLFLALALAAILAYRSGHLCWTAVLLALATLTRGDGLILAAVLTADYCWANWQFALRHAPAGPPSRSPGADAGCRPHGPRRANRVWRPALGAALLYVAVMLPLLAWLTWRFGSPLPATLAAKRAQAELGVTGFYAHTSYLQGLAILARARLAQSPLYALFLPALGVGLIAMWRRAGWVRLLVAWGAAHLLGYALLGVTPYYWYYAPLVPGLVSVAALGIVESGRWLARRGSWSADQPLAAGSSAGAEPPLLRLREMGQVSFRGITWLWAVALLLALAGSDRAMARTLNGPVPPPDDPVSKVLPEAKVFPYRLAGRWLRENTSPDALVGVTEVGVMGYYSQRPMLDFLGLLEPDVAEALARGDLYWALLRYQPDYLALTAVSPLYAYDLRADPWFQAAYAPVQSFDGPRFWGSPLTIYRRQVSRTALVESATGGLPDGATRLDADFGGQIRLLGAVTGESSAQPGDVLALTLYWQALGPVDGDYTVFVHLLGQYDRVLAQRDAPPGLGARPTSHWQSGQVIADPYLLALPQAAYAPDEAVWEVGLYDAATGQRLQLANGGDNVRFGAISIQPAAGPLRLDFGRLVLTGYELDRLALRPGEPLHVTLHCVNSGTATVSLQLASETGEVQSKPGEITGSGTGDSWHGFYTLSLSADAPPGVYDLEVLVTDPTTGTALPLLGADGQPRGDRAWLTRVRAYP